MSSEWSIVEIGDVCAVGDGAHSKVTRQSTGVLYLTSKNIGKGHLKLDSVDFISNEDFERLFPIASKATRRPQIGDVLIGIIGTFGNAYLYKKNDHFGFSSSIGILRPDQNKVIPKYLYYVITSNKFRNVHENCNSGSVQGYTNIPTIKKLQLPLPPIEAQKEIATTLGALDDRITLLRETNATLEAIAQALFKSWFVDFDPVHAKMQGTQPEGMDEQTAALFPDSFEESELGLVPAGWEVEFLTNVFDFKEGPGIRNWQYTNSDEGTKFINIRCIQDGDLTLGTANRITDEEANGKYLHFHLEEWDVVVSTSGTLGRSAIVRKEHLPLMLNTSVIRFRPIAEKVGFCFLYEYLNFPEFLYKLESMASGSVQKNFGPMHLKQIKLVCAPISIISDFEEICLPLFEKVIQNRARIDNLVSLRYTLLPRLISGQLRVGEI